MLNRYHGSLLGLAIGDALGASVEFYPPGTFKHISDLIGGGPHNLEPGQWTDDTSMALCLAESLLTRNEFNAADQMTRYYKWYKYGYRSSTGICFDIGNTIRTALQTYKRTGKPMAGLSDTYSAGNGSLMRLAPIPMFFTNMKQAITMAAASSKTTHAHIEAVDACRYYSYLIRSALQGKSKKEILAPLNQENFDEILKSHPTINQVIRKIRNSVLRTNDKILPDGKPLTPKIQDIAVNCTYRHKSPPEIQGIGYVVKSLEAALWAFYHSESFEEGVLKAVNLGDDADTTGAIFGQLAGAYYGIEGIPQHWIKKLAYSELIIQTSNELFTNRK